jgi:hypothetical protein
MTVLSDWEIRAHCEATQMVWPFRPDLLNPASLDVVLGDVLMVEMSGQKELEPYSISSATAENPYWETFPLPAAKDEQLNQANNLQHHRGWTYCLLR